MTRVDRLLQRWRIARAGECIAAGSRVLDIGCHDGALFRQLGARIREGVGIDPLVAAAPAPVGVSLYRGRFPDDLPAMEPFDVVTLLAVFEHVPAERQGRFLAGCRDRLRPGGLLVLTVPSPAVDVILHVLRYVRLVHGMSLHEHHGYRPAQTEPLARAAGFALERHSRFELGFNHLFAFRRVEL